jgi:hypothetical protein
MEDRLFAVNKDRTGYILLKPRELEKCQVFGSLHLCPRTNYVLRDFKATCISAVYDKPEFAHRVCKTTVLPGSAMVTQTERNVFHVYHPVEMTLTIDCGPSISPTRKPFRGLKTIRLEEGCKGHSTDYMVQSSESFNGEMVSISTNSTWTVSDLTGGFTPQELDIMLPQFPDGPVLVEDLYTAYWEIERSQYGFPWPALGFSLFGNLLLYAAIALVLYLMRHRIKRMFFSLMRTHPDLRHLFHREHRDVPSGYEAAARLAKREDGTPSTPPHERVDREKKQERAYVPDFPDLPDVPETPPAYQAHEERGGVEVTTPAGTVTYYADATGLRHLAVAAEEIYNKEQEDQAAKWEAEADALERPHWKDLLEKRLAESQPPDALPHEEDEPARVLLREPHLVPTETELLGLQSGDRVTISVGRAGQRWSIAPSFMDD